MASSGFTRRVLNEVLSLNAQEFVTQAGYQGRLNVPQ